VAKEQQNTAPDAQPGKPAATGKDKKKKEFKKKKERRTVPHGLAHISASFNNTQITITDPDGRVIVISAADPLNLIGILTAGDRIRAIAGTRIAFRDGIAVSVMEGDFLRPIAEPDMEVAMALAGRRVPVAAGYVGR